MVYLQLPLIKPYVQFSRIRLSDHLLPKAFAAGIHGANRLAGNALTETQVFGAIAGEYAAKTTLSVSSTSEVHPRVWTDQVRVI